MGMEICSEICNILIISPRISFSHDLNQFHDLPFEEERKQSFNENPSDKSNGVLDSNSGCDFDFDFDFDFSINESMKLEPTSSADELFFNGKILPIQIKKEVVDFTTQNTNRQSSPSPSPNTGNTNENEKKQSLKELLETSYEEQSSNHHQNQNQTQNHPFSKQFWTFNRSNSLNCENNGKNKSLIKSLHFLSRSNSTGSVPKSEKSMPVKNNKKQRERNQEQGFHGYNCNYNSLKKSQSKKNDNQRSYYGGGVRISPVLNLPSHCMANGGVGFFGFGSIFCNGKDKKNKKKKK